MRIFITLFLLSGLCFAKNDLTHRPKSFSTSFGKAVFVDFLTADYTITYNFDKKEAFVTAQIVFDMVESGLPIFDSVEVPLSVILNNQTVTSEEIKSPAKETTLRVIKKEVSAGQHMALITVPLKALVEFKDGHVKSAFWTSDLSERRFLESYMPASLEYDQVKMTFNVHFIGNKEKQVIYTNGDVKEITSKGNTFYKISYPEYFNASSIFFHTTPEGATSDIKFSLKSVDGREVPVTIYINKSLTGGGSLETLRNETTSVFHELEGDYGAWPHPMLIVYNSGAGGMEYCGATITSLSALGHEMFHSYFARGVMPANGNSGWLDEALASWRDKGYQTITTLNGTSRMSSRPYYTRTTDTMAYSFGERFMSLMDGKVNSSGVLKPFMRYMVENKKFSPIFVEEFIKEMTDFYNVEVESDFKKYTFDTTTLLKLNHQEVNPIHKKMSLEELAKFL